MARRAVENRLLELIQKRERELGRRIKQREIAESVHVSEHTITHWVRNETTRFDVPIIEGLCDYFNCDIADLLYFVEVEIDDPDL